MHVFILKVKSTLIFYYTCYKECVTKWLFNRMRLELCWVFLSCLSILNLNKGKKVVFVNLNGRWNHNCYAAYCIKFIWNRVIITTFTYTERGNKAFSALKSSKFLWGMVSFLKFPCVMAFYENVSARFGYIIHFGRQFFLCLLSYMLDSWQVYIYSDLICWIGWGLYAVRIQ